MALTAAQKSNLLFKALMGKGSSSDALDFFEESQNAKGIIFPTQVWQQVSSIPNTAPGSTTGVVQLFTDQVLTAIAGTSGRAYTHANLVDCIPFNFGDGTSYNYTVKDSGGSAIAFGQGDWVVDPAAGTLTFYGTVPSNMPPKITFYKYVGTKGVGGGSVTASTVTSTPSGNLAASTVQGALDELQSDIDTRQPVDSDLTAVAALSTTGLIARTGTGTASTRTVTGTASQIAVSNGDGVAGNPTLSLVSGAAASGTVLTADGAGGVSYAAAASAPTSPYELSNLGLALSVASSALTVALKQGDGSTNPASGAGAVKIGFRSSTLSSGAHNQRSVTGALSMVVSSGSTLGHGSGLSRYIYVYAIDNSGTVELAVSSAPLDESQLYTTTAEGGAGAATSNYVLYSTTARTNVPIRMIARLKTNQVTAGTWALVPTEVILGSADLRDKANLISLRYNNTAGTTIAASGVTTLVPFATRDYDMHGLFDGSNFTPNRAGRWKFTTKAGFDAPGASSVCKLLGYRTSGTVLISLDQYSAQTTGEAAYMKLTDTVSLTQGEQIQIRAAKSTTGTATLTTAAGANFLVIEFMGDN